MRRWRPTGSTVGRAAVLVGLGALTGWLCFQNGGFLAGATATAGLAVLIALLLWVMLSTQPVAGLGTAGLVGTGGLALLAVWTLASAQWSDAPARALIEFDRVLLYLATFALLACLPGGRTNARWLLRLFVLALSLAVLAGLVTRLVPGLSEAADAHADERLGWPLGYWNALGLAGTLALTGCVHLSSDLRESRVVRVLAAAAVPALAVAIYLTLSRGAIAAGVVGLVVLLLLGRARGIATAVVAVVPFAAYALWHAYGAEALVDAVTGDPASAQQGRALAGTLALACVGAAVVRVVGLFVDARLEGARLWRQWSLKRTVAVSVAALAIAIGVGLALDVDQALLDRWEGFTTSAAVKVDERRDRLTEVSANGRIDHWTIALDTWKTEPLQGHGAGTYSEVWAQQRERPFTVQDAHSLYLELLAELGIVGFAALVVGLLAPLCALILRRGEDRTLWSAVLALCVIWLLHAGIDWDWEMPALTLPIIALLGAASARETPRAAGRYANARLPRLLAGLAILLLLLTPARIGQSQRHLESALAQLQAGDCGASVESSLAAIDALDTRPQAFELLGYCDARLGQFELAIRMLDAAKRRDPNAWELYYGSALVHGAGGRDPRPDLRRALALNPLEPALRKASKRLDSSRGRVWVRESRRLNLPIAGA